LRFAANPADAQPDIDGRTLVGGEKVRIENNLSVRYRNQVGRDIGRQIAGIRFSDR
jgi:hypothetical protein